ncbi:hypothetical protein [Barrientosiimonas endolithica]|uniref:Uncharacterized protein n=1 Tax=Barrientosiimonas endolithica TaxID=1535208 RepID=A0ABM8HA17_9MICO|nr:hypothetical protein [Barrientosiimonas endolithica]BDZ57764.1 hypothetical protein GCM10025872_14210 [Barrientosiimonas endolithica]
MTDHRSGPEDDRARFAEIVAQLQSEPWPDIDDLDQGDVDVERDSEHGSGRASGSDSGRGSGEGEGSGDDGRTAGAGAPDETDGAGPGQPTEPGPDRATEPTATDPLAGLPSQWRMPTGESILDEEDGFVPPPPRPLPAGDLNFYGAIGGLVGGPLWLLYLFFFDRYARPVWWLLACAVFVGGLVLLILRQPEKRDDDWDDDVDGAVL